MVFCRGRWTKQRPNPSSTGQSTLDLYLTVGRLIICLGQSGCPPGVHSFSGRAARALVAAAVRTPGSLGPPSHSVVKDSSRLCLRDGHCCHTNLSQSDDGDMAFLLGSPSCCSQQSRVSVGTRLRPQLPVSAVSSGPSPEAGNSGSQGPFRQQPLKCLRSITEPAF